MAGLFAVALVSVLLGLTESAYPLEHGNSQLQAAENGTLSTNHRRYLLDGGCNEREWIVKKGTNCKYFERCSNGQHETFECPGVTVWNQDIPSCDDPSHVDIHTCTTIHHLVNGGSVSGHSPVTTQYSHVVQHSVHCGDGRCYHGNCNSSYLSCHSGTCSSGYRCHCNHGYDGHSCELQRVLETRCQYNKLHCGHGECVVNVLDSTYSCHCQIAYTGKECDLHIESGYNCNYRCQHGYCVLGSWTSNHFCHYTDGYTGLFCNRRTATSSTTTTTTKTKTSPTTVTSTTTAPSTTTASYRRCKVMTLLDLANQVAVTNPNITSCPSGSFATPEAFVLDHCVVSTPSTWTRGVNVMQVCHHIPLYTPIATFMNTAYSSRGGLSGVFLGCLPKGFKLGVQQCDALPKIIHVENGVFTMNPHLYYTVQ